MTRTRDQGLAFLSVLATLAIGASLVLSMLNRSDTRIAATSTHLSATRAILLAESSLVAVQNALQRDGRDAPDVDHYGEDWVTERQSAITLADDATLAVDIIDLTGRLNINDLRDAPRQQQDVFVRAFRQVGLPQGLVSRIAVFLRSNEPIDTLGELAEIGVNEDDLARLAGIATVLPEPYNLNLNTAPDAVVQALFPQPGMARGLLAEREKTSQITTADIRRFGGLTPAGVGWTSAYFGATATASLDEVTLKRQIIFARDPDDPANVTIHSQKLEGL